MKEEQENYISLREAAQYCSYSQEYLSLRARQGKLRSVKSGRAWVTTKEWLNEYIQKVEEYNKQVEEKKLAKEAVSEVVPEIIIDVPIVEAVTAEVRTGVIPSNLPIEPDIRLIEVKKPPMLRFGFVTALVFVSLFAAVFLGQDSFKQAYPLVRSFNEGFERGAIMAFVRQDYSTVNYQLADIGNLFGQYDQWISVIYSDTVEYIQEKVLIFSDEYTKRFNMAKEKFGRHGGISNFFSQMGEGFSIVKESLTERFSGFFLKLKGLFNKGGNESSSCPTKSVGLSEEELMQKSQASAISGIEQVNGLIFDQVMTKETSAGKLEIIDKITNDIFCAWMDQGRWVLMKGQCDQEVEDQYVP